VSEHPFNLYHQGDLLSKPRSITPFHQIDDLGTDGDAEMLRVTAGHDIEYPLRSAGSAVAYYLQGGKEPPGVWAGTAAGALGLTGQVDPEVYRSLFGKLIAPTAHHAEPDLEP
jgi:hypothetical protein